MTVSLSSGMRSALSALQTNTINVQQSQARLASGKRVGSALDNPANYFRAANLSSRANELSGLLDDMGQAQSVLKATSKGLDSVRSLIDSAKGLVGKALQAGQNNTLTGTKTTALKADDKLVGDTGMATGKKISIAVDGGTAKDVLTLDADSTVQDLVDGINCFLEWKNRQPLVGRFRRQSSKASWRKDDGRFNRRRRRNRLCRHDTKDDGDAVQ